MSIVTYDDLDTPVFEIDFLRYLFANGEAGFWLSYQPAHLYADVANTVPAVFGGGIASFDDLSGNGATGPQSVSTARPIFRASPARGEYDSADDVLPKDATLPAITDGTVILIGQQGIWIDEGYSFAGGDWSFGPTTYTGGPEGIIGVVGDMLDLVVIDRPLTADERDRVVAYGIERGSAGLIELGPELVTNTGPFSEVPPWRLSASLPDTTLAAENGDLVMSSAGPAAAHAIQDLGVDVFATGLYVLRFGVSDCSLISQMRVGRSNTDVPTSIPGNVVDSGAATLGENYRIYNATGTATRYLYLGGRSDMKSLSISKISLRRLIMPGDTP